MKYPKILTTKKSGREKFLFSERETDFDVLSFWSWSSSELLGNALRGVLAEFIVAKAIGAKAQLREEWDAFDLESTEGIKVEVKSSAYIQSWDQTKLSTISFDIRPTRLWLGESKGYSESIIRQADVYVFCIYAHQEKASANALNLDHWEFYVLPTATLNKLSSTQKSIGLSRLLKLKPKKVTFSEIHNSVVECYSVASV